MRKVLRELFSGPNGLSSKRVIGALSFFVSVGITLWVVAAEKDTAVLMYLYTFTAGLFGFGALEKKDR